MASIAGAVASITVAAPLDVVKTRIQNAHFESKEGGMTIIRNMVKQEGVGAFFKGLTPKVSIRLSATDDRYWLLVPNWCSLTLSLRV